MLVDRVRVPAADLHQLAPRGRARRAPASSRASFARQRARAELVTYFTAAPSLLERDPRVAEQAVADATTGATSSTADLLAPAVDLDGRVAPAAPRPRVAIDGDVAAGDAADRGSSAHPARARPELVELLLVGLAHLLEQRERRARLLLVDLRRARSRRGRAPSRRRATSRAERDRDGAAHARDLGLREAGLGVDQLDDLRGDA